MAQEINDVIREGVAEIRNASISIHGIMQMVAKGRVSEAQGLVLIAGENRRIDAALNFLKREGL